MAIKLKVITGGEVKLQVSDPDGARFRASEGIPIYPEAYAGSYEVTPTQDTQVLQTDHLMMTANVVVNPIPSNYGLITYNGSFITVS